MLLFFMYKMMDEKNKLKHLVALFWSYMFSKYNIVMITNKKTYLAKCYQIMNL